MRKLDRIIQRLRIAQAVRWISSGDVVLDIGCANGELLRLTQCGAGSLGIDPDLPTAATIGEARLLRGSFPQDLPAHVSFDVITMLAVLEHIPHDRQDSLAAACARCVRPGGRLLITVPSPRVDTILAVLRWFRLIDGMALEQHYGFDPQRTPAVFAAHGFRLVEHRRFQLGLNNLFVFRASQPVNPDSSEN